MCKREQDKIIIFALLLILSDCAMTAEQAAQVAAMDGCAVRVEKAESVEVFSGKAAAVAAQRNRELTVEGRR